MHDYDFEDWDNYDPTGFYEEEPEEDPEEQDFGEQGDDWEESDWNLLSDEFNPDDFDSSAFEAPDDIWRDSDFTRDFDDYSYREEFPDGIEGDAAYEAWLEDADD